MQRRIPKGEETRNTEAVDLDRRRRQGRTSERDLRMTRQIITQGGKPAFVVIPIEGWRRIEATLEDRVDAACLRTFHKNPTETFPDAVVAGILDGAHPLKALRDH